MASINIWNVKIDLLSKNEIIDAVQSMIDSGKEGIHITGVNPETIVDAQTNDTLRKAILDSDIVNVDNMLVVTALRRKGYSVPERAATPDVFEMLLGEAQRRGQSVFFLGAEQQVIEKMVENIRIQYPLLKIVGYRNGFYAEDEEPDIVATIKQLAPTYLFLGLPTPQKESFILKNKHTGCAKVLYGVGGAFDVKGEKVGRAPKCLRDIGLEGFFRVMQNPSNYGKRILKYYPKFLQISNC